MENVILSFAQINPQTTPRFELIPFDIIKVDRTKPPYLAQGLIPRRGLTVVYGPPKCGKSFWVLDLAMHIALGWDYRDRRVEGGPVVYCAFEGAEGMKARIEAFREEFLRDDPDTSPVPFYLMPIRVDLIKNYRDLIQSIGLGTAAHPKLVVLDTLNRSLVGSENTDQDMSDYINAAEAICQAFDCAVIIVHHSGKAANDPRGHSALMGAVDGQLLVKQDKSKNIVVKVERMKDGAAGEKIISALKTIALPFTENGNPIESCVVVPVETSTTESDGSPNLGAKQKFALEVLDQTLSEHSFPAPKDLGLPEGITVVGKSQWREELYDRGILSKDASNPSEDYSRLRKSLIKDNLIAEKDIYIWKPLP